MLYIYYLFLIAKKKKAILKKFMNQKQ